MPQQLPAIGEDVSHLFSGGNALPAVGEDVSHLFASAAPTITPDTRLDPHQKPPSAEDFATSGWPAKIGDVALGALKSVGDTARFVGETAGNAGLIPGVLPNALGPSEMRNPVFTRADEALKATNTAQKIGKVIEQGAEFLLPTGAAVKAGIEAMPTVARAGSKFQEVMGAARNIPVNITEPGNVALRIQELADRGASMPMAVRKFLGRITDPEKAALTYEEARDFSSNISRLSANEFQRLSPAVGREVAGLRVALNKAVADAANKAGKGKEFGEAMMEYARAKRLENLYDSAIEGFKKGAPYFGAAGAGTWFASRLRALLPE